MCSDASTAFAPETHSPHKQAHRSRECDVAPYQESHVAPQHHSPAQEKAIPPAPLFVSGRVGNVRENDGSSPGASGAIPFDVVHDDLRSNSTRTTVVSACNESRYRLKIWENRATSDIGATSRVDPSHEKKRVGFGHKQTPRMSSLGTQTRRRSPTPWKASPSIGLALLENHGAVRQSALHPALPASAHAHLQPQPLPCNRQGAAAEWQEHRCSIGITSRGQGADFSEAMGKC